MTKGRSKGNRAELEVAALVEEWWTTYEPEARFKRTPLSGGWGDATVRGAFNASGDLMTTSSTFPFCVEVKRRERWSVDRLMAGKASPVWSWWRQTQTAAEEMKLEPMMWFRHNRTPWLVMVRDFFAARLRSYGSPAMSWGPLDVDVGDAHPIVLRSASVLSIPPKGVIACASRARVV